MSYSITKVDVWAGTIDDRPGGLAEKLEALANSGASLEFVIARRAPGRATRRAAGHGAAGGAGC